MASLDDRLTAAADGTTGSATGVAAATATENSAATMGTAADAITTLPEDSFSATRTGTSTVSASTGAGIKGASRSTGRSKAMAAMAVTTNVGTALTTGTARQADKTDNTQASIILPSPKANIDKDIHKTPTNGQRRLSTQIHTLLLQDSPDITHINDSENKPVAGIINIPKSITIRALHSFGVGTNPIG